MDFTFSLPPECTTSPLPEILALRSAISFLLTSIKSGGEATYTYMVRLWDNKDESQYKQHDKRDVDQNLHCTPQELLNNLPKKCPA
jgi:hypothetical protein